MELAQEQDQEPKEPASEEPPKEEPAALAEPSLHRAADAAALPPPEEKPPGAAVSAQEEAPPTPASDERIFALKMDDRPNCSTVTCETANPGQVASDTGYTFWSPKTKGIIRVLHRDDETREEAITRVRANHGL